MMVGSTNLSHRSCCRLEDVIYSGMFIRSEVVLSLSWIWEKPELVCLYGNGPDALFTEGLVERLT